MFYAVPNLSSDTVFEIQEPWKVQFQWPSTLRVKGDHSTWCIDRTTNHAFISGFRGILSGQRIQRSSNQPFECHGFVVDYDGNVTQSMLDALATSKIGYMPPAYYCRTFSGKARLIWVFESPVRMPENPTLLAEWLKIACRKMSLRKWLAGLDDAFFKPQQYYDIGIDWTAVNPTGVIPTSDIWQWMYEAGQEVSWSDRICRIPIEHVAAEVEKRWPGRWQGAFVIGQRGVRFWDLQADNATSAVVRESGMQCFTGNKTFVPWTEIFGAEFTKDYQASQLDVVASSIFYDGRSYWIKDGVNSKWVDWSKDDLRLMLRVKHRLKGTTNKKEVDQVSELDHAMQYIHGFNRVEAALPFIHRPDGILIHDGKRFLNTAVNFPMKPTGELGNWGEHFPWLAGLLDHFFVSGQLPFFLSWLKYFYVNALSQTPQDGQALFLVGEAGTGKSLLATKVISALVGGYSDSSSYFLGEDRFTAHILSKPIMLVDDTAPTTDHIRHLRYSSMIKKVVANRELTFEQKFQKAGMVPWQGRVVVCCNADPESIRLLPNMDLSIRDKICLFSCNERAFDFPEPRVVEEALSKELPAFATWLTAYVIPPDCVGKSRFYVRAFHDPRLIESSIQGSQSYTFFEALAIFLEEQARLFKERTMWTGTVTELYTSMCADEGLKIVLGKTSVQQLATYLGQLKARGFPIRYRHARSRRVWEIPYNLQLPSAEGAT